MAIADIDNPIGGNAIQIASMGIKVVEGWGDSYPAGYTPPGGVSPSNFVNRIAAACGAYYVNNQASTNSFLGKSGLSVASIGGGWPIMPYYWHRLARGSLGNNTNLEYENSPAPQSQLIVDLQGMNDLPYINPGGSPTGVWPPNTTKAGQAWASMREKIYVNNYLARISRAIGWQAWEDTDAIIPAATGWSTQSPGAAYASNGTLRQCGTAGDPLVINIPTSSSTPPVPWPAAGCTVAIYMAASSTNTGILTITHGTFSYAMDMTDVPATSYHLGGANQFLYCVRVPNVLPGDTITIVGSGIVGGGPNLDEIIAEAPSNLPVYLGFQHPLLSTNTGQVGASLSNYGNWNNQNAPIYTIGDTDVQQMNAILSEAVAQYGSPRIISVGVSAMDHLAAAFNSYDYVHPSLYGEQLFAQLGLAALSGSTYTMQDSSVCAPGGLYQNGGTSISTNSGVGPYSIPHGLAQIPSKVSISPGSANATLAYVSSVDRTNINFTFASAPSAGLITVDWTANV